jgi:hypothetical protein
MAKFNSGADVAVGDACVLDGRRVTVTRTSPQNGNEAPVTVEVTVPARLLTPAS